MTGRNEFTQLLLIAEKLLALAEEQAETDLDDMRSRARFRRSTLEQLDRIEASVSKIKAPVESGEIVLTHSDLKRIVVKFAPWVVSALAAFFHVLRSMYHF